MTDTLYYPTYDTDAYTLLEPGVYDDWNYDSNSWEVNIELARAGVIVQLELLFLSKVNADVTYSGNAFAGGIEHINLAHAMYDFQTGSLHNNADIKVTLADGHTTIDMNVATMADYYQRRAKNTSKIYYPH